MDVPIRALIIEDSASDAALEVRALEAAEYRVTYVVGETAAEMKAALAGQTFDIVLTDANLPQFDALGALAVLKESGLDIPLIIVSGSIGEETAVAMMKAGVNDYVLKDKLFRLAVVVEHALEEAEQRRRRVQAEDLLKQNQQHQLQVRDQFLSRMSHELRSPLTAIHQFVTILLDGLAGNINAEQRDYLMIVLRNVNSLRTMISDLLEVTRAESGRLTVDLRCVYLADLIPQMLKTLQLANTKDLDVSFDVPADLPPVLADPDRVRQILDNLLGNAIKFTPDKGRVGVQVRESTRNRGFLRIAVTDTGPGIVKSEHEKVFEYLYQVENKSETDHRGLGIGLHICKELVSSQGGQIWVRSHRGHGSTFAFTLPVFSLESQLASIVKAADLITHSVALVTVEISHAGERLLSPQDQAALRDAWDALQGCALTNLVVLLPRVPHALSRELFFIVACVNEGSAEVLVGQLRHQLERCQSLRDSLLEPEISYALLDTRAKRSGGKPKEIAREEVMAHIEGLMKTAMRSEGGLYEWSQDSHSG